MGRLMISLLLCSGLWLLWSGHFEVFVLSLGGISVLLVGLLSYRMGLLDREGLPIQLFHRAPVYWIWLSFEIVKANIDVCRRIIAPSLPIDPVETEIPASQDSDLGRAAFANSITLTPGTVSTGVEEGSIRIHALTSAAAEELREGKMDQKVVWLEQGK